MSDEILQGSREKGGPMNAAVVRASRALPLRRVTPSMMDPNARALRGVKEIKSCAILGKGKKIYAMESVLLQQDARSESILTSRIRSTDVSLVDSRVEASTRLACQRDAL